MTYISGISQSYTTQSASQTKTDEKSDTLGMDDFLTLLVAQLQNQDPLNPTDSTEFTSQLTQYSQLEQSMDLNDRMDDLIDIQKSSDRLSALSLIDKNVLVEGSSFDLGDGDVEIGYRINGEVSDLQLRIMDSGGSTVATLYPADLGQGNHSITWDGSGRTGDHLPAGSYDIAIDYIGTEEGDAPVVQPLVHTMVNGVDLSGTEATLLTSSGEVNLSAIQGVYETANEQSAPEDGAEDDDATASTEENVSAATDGAGIIHDTATTTDSIQETAGTVSGDQETAQ